ncbi:hydroxymethylglutaryl-CoA synthase family protein [Myxococcus xanthus]|uniref:Hydroxymethylglutaryl-CoA synthase n=1 Tax=Myxococcus fulvus TaxID=33 RepID=T1SF51_MYXFU|nr:hydroxymethylglutaryl-CoA synthase [Myxococcus xanthus]AGS77285.1 hydroxymethylglutaryl-CoA synthase [Myxococcus fulvus]QPM79762.1 hydroxymethylglutaryl-CoA synthase family protein [Myxococcus xanthus]QVV57714.1 MxnE [Vector pDPO-mxn116-Pvan-Tpase]
MRVGIERMNVYGGAAAIGVRDLFVARGLNLQRFDNLMMREKSVGLPWEDPVTHAVNAARPLIDRLSEAEKARIEMVVTASESGIDFGKSISTYVHHHLQLSRRCKLFEVKQACYGGTAALGIAVNHVIAHAAYDPKVLVIATDVARSADKLHYAEPSQGSGAVAFLVGTSPEVLEIDVGATGFHGYEVMDTCRPAYDIETGNPDLSLFSYLDCLERCFEAYADRVEGADVVKTFEALAFHTPFGGMVKGAHRKLLRKFAGLDSGAIERDFAARVGPSLEYCVRVGNLYSASLYLALSSLVDNVRSALPMRVGLFSYGSGCSSEFFSGLLGPASRRVMAEMNIGARLDRRCRLSMEEYDALLDSAGSFPFGAKDLEVGVSRFGRIYEEGFAGEKRLVLRRIRDYHREYEWS